MPTPVAVARQCLAEAAAAVLDDAVSVAKKRGHGQTTSLHAVSALLALPSSALREACARARSSAYSPRLQFRALELRVGVALDRISSSKSSASAAASAEEREPPPVSNSLMAAIKRSQANQRRHPETFHLYQLTSSSSSISAVKVELKHVVISILDDPIVSRVFDDAGFRTHEIKLTILNPLALSRFSSPPSHPPPPPFFLCSLRDFELNKPYLNLDDNSRRIGEILFRRQNPLLIGACASDAYRKFIDSITQSHSEFLPKEIANLKVASIEHELSEFISRTITEDLLRLKLQQAAEDCEGRGIIAACGDLKKFLEVESAEAVSSIVLEMKKVLSKPGAKFCLIGFLERDDIYSKLVKEFPDIEKDWDLQLLPITTASIAEKCFKSSLMKSFVPLGGLFPMPSELENTSTAAVQPSSLCKSCDEKCKQEVDTILKGQSTDPVTNKQPVNLSSCLQIAECETNCKTSCTVEAKADNKALTDYKILGLRRKWSDICQRLHCSWKSPGEVNKPDARTYSIPSFPNAPGMGSLSDLQMNPRAEQNIYNAVVSSTSINAQETNTYSDSQKKMNQPIGYTTSRSVLPMTTDLQLGTFYNSSVDCRRKPQWQDHNSCSIQNSESSTSCEKSISPSLFTKSPPYSHNHEKYAYVKDLEHPWRILAEKVPWQADAIRTICRTVSRCRNRSGVCRVPNSGNVWLGFSGPDKVGKRKIAASIVEIVFGRNEHLIQLDLKDPDISCDGIDSIVDCYSSGYHFVKSGRKMIVDHLAEELRKHPHSVILLENVAKADFLVRRSLLQAVQTGKFPDSYGRDINVNNVVFILASTTIQKGSADAPLTSEFPEEKILKARNLQMRISVESGGDINRRDDSWNVLVTLSSKRKQVNDDFTKGTVSKRVCCFPRFIIDLNLPVEDEVEEETSEDDGQDSSDESGLMWMEELLEHVDESILFKPFDFDSLNKKVLKEIDVRMKKVVGGTNRLEICREAMAQILAAAWVADEEKLLLDWIEGVLCIGMKEARQKRDAGGDLVMKLTPCDGMVVEEEAAGICLPARINVK